MEGNKPVHIFLKYFEYAYWVYVSPIRILWQLYNFNNTDRKIILI